MKKITVSLAILATLAGSSLVLAETPKMHGRAALNFVSPDDTIEVDGDEVDSEIDSALGLGLAWEYRFTDLIGLDVNWSYAKHDVELSGSDFDEVTFMPVTVGANFHLLPDSKVDLFVGPFVGYAFYGDLENDGVEIEIDDDIVYGVNAGIEVPVGEKWAFFGSLKYMKAGADAAIKAEAEPAPTRALVVIAEPDVDIDPLVAQVGVAFRY